MKIKCYECGKRIDKDEEICPNCGARQSKSADTNLWKDYKKITTNEENVCPACGHVETDLLDISNTAAADHTVTTNTSSATNETRTTDTTSSNSSTNSEISKTLIGILAILFGAYGIHHFFLGHIKRGILSILFCWTLVPTVLSIAEGIHILCMSEEQFQRKYYPEG